MIQAMEKSGIFRECRALLLILRAMETHGYWPTVHYLRSPGGSRLGCNLQLLECEKKNY